MKVYFLFHSGAFWPSWESFWDACVADDNIETKMIYCPVKPQYPGFEGQFVNAENFLKEKNIPYIHIDDIDLFTDTPDVLVMQTPYDDWHRDEKYSSKTLKSTGAKLIYISYGLMFTETNTAIYDHFIRKFYDNMWRNYVFADFIVSDYKKFAEIDSEHAVCVGHPKFDALHNANKKHLPTDLLDKIGDRPIGLWHPHFPCKYSGADGNLELTTFDWAKDKQILDYILSRNDVFWIFMPHHMFFGAFESTPYNIPHDEIENFKNKIQNAENMHFWTGDYPDILAACDFCIGERSSVTMEALYFNKPVCYVEKKPEVFNIFGKDTLSACSYANTVDDVIHFINDTLSGQDTQKDQRTKVINTYYKQYADGKCGERIKNDILSSCPKISVIMPVYNAEKYLKESIDSILNQTFKHFELLIIDDGSMDDTRQIIQSYTDPRVKLIDGPCRGISAALNVGIKCARGDYIARMDADDIALPNRLADQLKFMESHPSCGICAGKAEYFGGGENDGMQFGWWWPRNNEGEHIKVGIWDLVTTCMICHPATMFNKKLFYQYNLLYNEDFTASEDQELWCRACLLFDIYIINTLVLKYRYDGKSNATIKHSEGKQLAMLCRENLIKKIFPEYQHFTDDYPSFEQETQKVKTSITNMCKKSDSKSKTHTVKRYWFKIRKYIKEKF